MKNTLLISAAALIAIVALNGCDEQSRQVEEEIYILQTVCDKAAELMHAMVKTNVLSSTMITNAVAAQMECLSCADKFWTHYSSQMSPRQSKRYYAYWHKQMAKADLDMLILMDKRLRTEDPLFYLKELPPNMLTASNQVTGSHGIRNKIPTYIDCKPDQLVIYPGEYHVTDEDLYQPTNRLVRLLDRVQANTNREYLVIMVRPGSVKFYRKVKKIISAYSIETDFDAVDADFVMDWKKEAASRGIPVEPPAY